MVRIKIRPSSVTLTLGLPELMFQMAHLHCDGEQLCQVILKSIHNSRSYCPDKFERTHGRTNMHRTIIVTTISHSPQAGSIEKKKQQFFRKYSVWH